MIQKGINSFFLLFFLLLICLDVSSQDMNISTYQDLTIPRVEPNGGHYGFIYPVEKDCYSLSDYTPPAEGRFFVQNYGPRFIGNYDNHQGMDIWGHTTYNGVLTINPPAKCMCDGELISIVDGTDLVIDPTTSGRTLRVRCDSMSQVYNSPINIYFRHLDSINVNLVEGMQVQKGDTLGFVGESGTTTLSHLHLDYSGVPNNWGNNNLLRYLNPMRLFDPNEHPHVIGKLDNPHIEILHDWQDSTLIRIHWPHNQHINRFEFTNDGYNLVYDVEEVRASYTVFEPSIWVRDSMKIFPNRTNGYRTALYYQENITYPAYFPNSVDRDADLNMYGYPHIPFTADSVVNVYDFVLENVPSDHDTKDWVVKLSDVWGNVAEGVPDCSTIVTNTTNWGAGSLRAAINCAEPNDTIFFDANLNNSILDVDLPVIHINKVLYFQINPSQDITLSNKLVSNTDVLFSISDELHLLGLKVVGKSDDSMILKVEAGGSITVHSGCLEDLDIRN